MSVKNHKIEKGEWVGPKGETLSGDKHTWEGVTPDGRNYKSYFYMSGKQSGLCKIRVEVSGSKHIEFFSPLEVLTMQWKFWSMTQDFSFGKYTRVDFRC